MKFSQRDFVTLESPMPDDQENNHPILIISCNSVNSKGDYYTGMMMSTTDYTDSFSFKITNDMFEGHLRKENCHLRTYIIISIKEDQIKSKINKMEVLPFKNLIKQVFEYVLFVDK